MQGAARHQKTRIALQAKDAVEKKKKRNQEELVSLWGRLLSVLITGACVKLCLYLPESLS